MIRAALILLALLSPFLFPWPLTAALSFIAALLMPPVALIVGIMTDGLYYGGSSGGWPWATILGALGFLLALLVQRFVKTRIIR